MPFAVDWTDEEISTLKRLWSEEVSSGQIAKTLNRSRGSVMGKINRLGLMGTTSKAPVAGQKKAKPVAKAPEPQALEPIKPIAAPVIPPDPKDKTIIDLKARECRWPLGDPMAKPEFFCGCRTTSEKNPYCEEHSKQAFYTWNKPSLKLPRRV